MYNLTRLIHIKFRMDDVAFITSLAILSFLVFIFNYFPFVDITNHVARYYLINQYFFGKAPSYIEFYFSLTPYVGLDLFFSMFASFLTPEHLAKFVSLLTLLALPTASYLCFRVISPQQRGWAIIMALLSLNFNFMIGFVNYSMACSFVLFFIAHYYYTKNHITVLKLVFLSLLTMIVFSTHLFGVVLLMIFITAECINTVLRSVFNYKSFTISALYPLFYLFTPVVTTLIIFTVIMIVTSHESNHYMAEYYYSGLYAKIARLSNPFFIFSKTQLMISSFAYLSCFMAFVLANTKNYRFPLLAFVTCSLLFICYAFFPDYYDTRFLLPILIFVFILPVVDFEKSSINSRWLTIPFLSLIAHASVIFYYSHNINSELKHYNAVLNQLPYNSHVLPLLGNNAYTKINPYQHFAHWHAIKRNGRVPVLFSGTQSNPHLNHFMIKKPLLYWHSDSWAYTLQPFNWHQIKHDYDYVILSGKNPQISNILNKHANKFYSSGDIQLYSIPKAFKK